MAREALNLPIAPRNAPPKMKGVDLLRDAHGDTLSADVRQSAQHVVQQIKRIYQLPLTAKVNFIDNSKCLTNSRRGEEWRRERSA